MEQNAVDARLAELRERHGQDLIEEFTQEFDNLHRELAILRQELCALAEYRLYRGTTTPEPAWMPETALIDPCRGLRRDDGFYGLEYTPDGTPFRWTGPSPEFRFDVLVDRTAGADLRLHALSSIDLEIQGNVTLIADGGKIPVEVVREPPGLVLTAFLPPRAGNGITSLVFAVAAVLVPPGGKDQRPLGIAFAQLSVTARAGRDAEIAAARFAAQ
jgi:hypothetical protein